MTPEELVLVSLISRGKQNQADMWGKSRLKSTRPQISANYPGSLPRSDRPKNDFSTCSAITRSEPLRTPISIRVPSQITWTSDPPTADVCRRLAEARAFSSPEEDVFVVGQNRRPSDRVQATQSTGRDHVCPIDSSWIVGRDLRGFSSSETPPSALSNSRISLCDDSHDSVSIQAILRPKRSIAPPNTPMPHLFADLPIGSVGEEALQVQPLDEADSHSEASWFTISLDESSPTLSDSTSVSGGQYTPLLQTPAMQDDWSKVYDSCDEENFLTSSDLPRGHASTPLQFDKAKVPRGSELASISGDSEAVEETFLTGLAALGLYASDSSSPSRSSSFGNESSAGGSGE